MRLAKEISTIIDRALTEDRWKQDITTNGICYGGLSVESVIKAKEDGVCAGINIVESVFKRVNKNIKIKVFKKDGSRFKNGDTLARIQGHAKSILTAERTALNLFSRLCGIATLTRKFVDKVKPCKIMIMDTRKTTPGLRIIEKYAVRMGGGYNHRYDLSDGVLIKDNHIISLRKKMKVMSLGLIVERVRKKTKNKLIEIEVTNISEFKDVVIYAPDIIMLDNMSVTQIKECVKIRNRTNKSIRLEISGGVNLQSIKSLARLGVDRISIGCLTHSPKSIDLSLEFIP